MLLFTLYGNFGKSRVSTENIFSVPGKSGVSKRRLAEFLHDLGYSAIQNDNLSSRVCAKYASKIRRAADLKSFLDAGLVKTECSLQIGVDSPPERFKRISSSPHVSSARKLPDLSPLLKMIQQTILSD